MSITINATYENGILRPSQPVFLREHQQVRITIEEPVDWVYRTRGIVPCSDHALNEWAAMDPELEFGSWEGP